MAIQKGVNIGRSAAGEVDFQSWGEGMASKGQQRGWGFPVDAAGAHREVQTAPEGRNTLKIRITLKCLWF